MRCCFCSGATRTEKGSISSQDRELVRTPDAQGSAWLSYLRTARQAFENGAINLLNRLKIGGRKCNEAFSVGLNFSTFYWQKCRMKIVANYNKQAHLDTSVCTHQ